MSAYHVVIQSEVPESDSVDLTRSRMGLLNAAMARVIKEADEFAITYADYDKGCLELDVVTRRLHGITDGRVSVWVREIPAGAAQVQLRARPA